jgi:hypothetical protein
LNPFSLQNKTPGKTKTRENKPNCEKCQFARGKNRKESLKIEKFIYTLENSMTWLRLPSKIIHPRKSIF